MGKRGFGAFSTFFTFLGRFLPVFVPYFALFPSMPCAYLYVHNFLRTRVSRIGRGNLAFDKETALDGQGPFDSAALRSGQAPGRRDEGVGNAERGMRNAEQTAKRQGPRAVTFSREPTCHGVVPARRDDGGRRARAVGGRRGISHLTKKQPRQRRTRCPSVS